MSDDAKVPDIIIERAVELWCRALKRPEKDNGDQSYHGAIGRGMAEANMEAQIAKVDDYPAAIERFREILVKRLKFARDHEGELTGKGAGSAHPERYRLTHGLHCDYNPDRELAEAAEEAGLPLSAFSWKSDVSYYGGKAVSTSFGYGVGDTYHYPLSDGRWLVCKLQGEDMPKIVKAVEEGHLTLEVEDAR